MQTVAVIDYGMGNLRSVAKALEHVAGASARIIVTSDDEIIAGAERVVFPGQGAIRDCMRELQSRSLLECVRDAIYNKPFLGICLGQQALMEYSEEHTDTRGFGVFSGSVKRFPKNARDARTDTALKVPHMGWNSVSLVRDHPLWQGIEDGAYFYFVHSYYIAPQDPALAVGLTDYGLSFASAIAKDNLFAVQFHPEKSARVGLQLLKNFLSWDGAA